MEHIPRVKPVQGPLNTAEGRTGKVSAPWTVQRRAEHGQWPRKGTDNQTRRGGHKGAVMAIREETGRRRKERRGGQGRPHLNRDRPMRQGQPFRDEGGAFQKDRNCQSPEVLPGKASVARPREGRRRRGWEVGKGQITLSAAGPRQKVQTGLPWWSSGEGSVLLLQGARVWAPVG